MNYRETVQTVETRMLESFELEITKLEEKKRKLANHRDWCQNKLSRLLIEMEETFPKAFKAIDLEIISLNPSTHFNDSLDYGQYCPRVMSVSFTCRMIGRRKPYEKTWIKAEEKRREGKRKNDQEKFKAAACGKYSCQINQFTLDKEDKVLVEIYI